MSNTWNLNGPKINKISLIAQVKPISTAATTNKATNTVNKNTPKFLAMLVPPYTNSPTTQADKIVTNVASNNALNPNLATTFTFLGATAA